MGTRTLEMCAERPCRKPRHGCQETAANMGLLKGGAWRLIWRWDHMDLGCLHPGS